MGAFKEEKKSTNILLRSPVKDTQDSKHGAPEEIVLVFDWPEPDKLRPFERNHLSKLREKHPTAEIIFVDKNDFTENDDLKPECEHKYEAFQRATLKTKVKIEGHGAHIKPYSEYIYSHHDAYTPPRTGWQAYCGFFNRENGPASFSAKLIANLIKRIKHPAVYKSRKELTAMYRLPDEHLRVSVRSCYGQRFSEQLYQQLLQDNNGKSLLCAITTSQKNLILTTNPNGDATYGYAILHYGEQVGNKTLSLTKYGSVAAAVGFAIGYSKHDVDVMYNAAIAFCVFTAVAIAWKLFSSWRENDVQNTGSNRADKVVLIPDFKQLRESKETDGPIPSQIIPKEEFLRIYQPERIAHEVNDSLHSLPQYIELQSGVVEQFGYK